MRHIPIETGTDYWVGRLGSNNIHIDDAMLSRKHAEIKVNRNGEWTVSDNKSANGTYVTPRNGVKRRLGPMSSHVLEDLDLLQFGVERPGTDEAPFRWRFHKALKFASNANLPPKSLVNRDGSALSSSGRKRSNDEELEASSSSSTGVKRSRLSNGLDEQLSQYRRQLEEMQAELKRKEEEKEKVRKEVEVEAKSKMEAAQEEMARLIEEEKTKFADELKGAKTWPNPLLVIF